MNEMPYDLNQVTNLTMHFANGFDILKLAIEYLARNQSLTTNRIDKMEKGMVKSGM